MMENPPPNNDYSLQLQCINGGYSWGRNIHDLFGLFMSRIASIYDMFAGLLTTAAPNGSNKIAGKMKSGGWINKRNSHPMMNESYVLNDTSTFYSVGVTSANGVIHILYNENDTLKHRYFNGSVWSFPLDVLIDVVGPPSLTSSDMGCLEAVILNNHGSIMYGWYANGIWGSFSAIITNIGTDPFKPSGSPSILSTSANRTYVYISDTHGRLRQNYKDFPSWFSVGWKNLGASMGVNVTGSSPKQGQIDLVGLKNNEGRYMYFNGTDFTHPITIFSNLSYAPTVISMDGKRIFYFQFQNGSAIEVIGGVAAPDIPGLI
jgi:hypothetical protein